MKSTNELATSHSPSSTDPLSHDLHALERDRDFYKDAWERSQAQYQAIINAWKAKYIIVRDALLAIEPIVATPEAIESGLISSARGLIAGQKVYEAAGHIRFWERRDSRG